MPSRSGGRAPRTSGGRFAATTPHSNTSASVSGSASRDNDEDGDGDGDGDGDMFRDERVVKKRKLEIRVGPKQQTLESLGFFARAVRDAGSGGQAGGVGGAGGGIGGGGAIGLAHAAARPPSKIAVKEPGGQLVETVNGVRNELSISEDAVGSTERVSRSTRPAPATVPVAQAVREVKKEEKRTLRSQDEGPRLKSELAVYFPNYEDVMFDTPREQEFVTVDTNFYIAEDTPRAAKAETPSPAKNSRPVKATPTSSRTNGVLSLASPSQSSSIYAPGTSVLDLSTFLKNVPEHPEDPLPEAAFLKSHKRAERKEKQLRNIERERAMHEKVQLDRLLDGLQGHDWLKVLGITGVTDGAAKEYEPKRDYFIAEVQALVDKFKQWKEEERRQRLEKEAALAAEREAEEEEDEADDEDEDGDVDTTSTSLGAASTDSASRQLHNETLSSLHPPKSKPKSSTSITLHRKQPTKPSTLPPPPPIPYRPPSPIMSFYSKRHLRDAALKKTRHGRTVIAFGQPVPEMEEREFELPGEMVTEDVLRASARERRRRKRESVANANGSGG